KTLSWFIPVIDTPVVRTIFFLLLFGGLAWINIRGAKYGVRFIIFTTVAKLIPLLLIVGFGTGHISMENLQWKIAPTFSTVGASSLVLFYAFLGIETAVTNSGEFKNPARTVPLGVLSGISFVLILYILIQLISQGVLGDQLTANKEAPLAAVSKILFGDAGIALVVAGTAISIFGNISGEILAIPRILFAGARDKILPGVLASVHPVFQTPHIAIAVYAALGFLFAVFGAFKQLIILSSAATLLIYLGVVLAVIRLRLNRSAGTERTFTIPGGIFVPLLASAIILWLLSNLSDQEMLGTAIFLATLAAIFFLLKFFKKKEIVHP
ncbi:MAG TPA: amino acid permease, partial [Ferruginibacter sp.]|nr:amino acid permease [Ferruginibacter sp.]